VVRVDHFSTTPYNTLHSFVSALLHLSLSLCLSLSLSLSLTHSALYALFPITISFSEKTIVRSLCFYFLPHSPNPYRLLLHCIVSVPRLICLDLIVKETFPHSLSSLIRCSFSRPLLVSQVFPLCPLY
jgi:hypothetical protein